MLNIEESFSLLDIIAWTIMILLISLNSYLEYYCRVFVYLEISLFSPEIVKWKISSCFSS